MQKSRSGRRKQLGVGFLFRINSIQYHADALTDYGATASSTVFLNLLPSSENTENNGEDTMEDNSNSTGDYRFMILENKAAQIRKLLLGSLILAKDTWKEELSSSPKGLDVMMAMEKAEEEFFDATLTDPMERLDRALSISNTRAQAIVMAIDYLAGNKQA
ncbi:MAG TPA: hypothetical protein DDX85_14500 [Nitrospiraceae bacterium]|nr:hypothetical protein [Nitrospiraceae bacterium]